MVTNPQRTSFVLLSTCANKIKKTINICFPQTFDLWPRFMSGCLLGLCHSQEIGLLEPSECDWNLKTMVCYFQRTTSQMIMTSFTVLKWYGCPFEKIISTVNTPYKLNINFVTYSTCLEAVHFKIINLFFYLCFT